MDRIAQLWPAVLLAIAAIAVVAYALVRKVEMPETPPLPAAKHPMGLPLPVLVDADGDGDEDLLIGGRLVDGVTWTTRWTVPESPVVIGQRGVVARGRSLKVVDLKSGAEVANEAVPFDIAETCVTNTMLVVRQSDGRSFTYDPLAMTLGDAAPDCRPSDRPPACANARADCSLVGAGDLRLAEPPLEVQVRPATGALVGLDADGVERYSEVIGTQGRIADIDLVDKRVFVFRDGVHVFDAETGNHLWQTDAGNRMRVGAKRVYLSVSRAKGPTLDVLDASNGTLVKTLLGE
jgi:hypothetical protein